MATMVKEKKREKKKVREKHVPRNVVETSEPSISSSIHCSENDIQIDTETVESFVESVDISYIQIESSTTTTQEQEITNHGSDFPKETVCYNQNLELSQETSSSSVLEVSENCSPEYSAAAKSKPLRDEHPGSTYEDLQMKMERMAVPSQSVPLTTEQETSLEAPSAYLKDPDTITLHLQLDSKHTEDVVPSAPVFEEVIQPEPSYQEQIVIKEETPKAQCMPIEQAVWLFGGQEMSEVQEMSDREEAIVEVGPLTGPDHPLVDLLSTLRSSLICLERERTQLFKSFNEEEKSRSALWRIEKKTVYVSDVCPCGASVQFRGKYEHADFLMDKLPAARMRLTALLRDVQECYCHHQHAALLAFYQIEDFLSHVVKSNKNEIRESISLVLQALKLSDSTPPVLSKLLERWAAMLASAMVDARDPRQLLFLLHHLFRQSRSVRWAARAVRVSVSGRPSAARALALLHLMLARPALESAVECVEETEEAWEEVDRTGGSGAVRDGSLRERDLLALLKALPLRQLVASILLFTHSDISKAREQDWRDLTGGGGVLRASGGVRALLGALHAARAGHSHYERLHRTLCHIAEKTLHGLAGLHVRTEASYNPEMQARIPPELEACFAAAVALFGPHHLHRIPATLLSEATAREFCIELILQLHDASPQQLSSLSVNLPRVTCAVRVTIVTAAAVRRTSDHELARTVLEFLMQTGLKKKSVPCKAGCDLAARARIPELLDAHPYLYTIALHLIADMNQVESLEPSCVKHIQTDKWLPSNGELVAVLDDWSRRCPPMLQHLLMNLTCTVHVGLSLQTQLTLGTWLCSWSRSQPGIEWHWAVLRRLRVHRAAWSLPLEAPDPAPEPEEADLFSTAHALLATSWGHSIPLICSHGAAALCRLASARPADAAHCLSAVLLAMAASPDSIALAHKFTEFFNIMLNSGPGLVQRALGLGGASGRQLLQKVMLAHLGDQTDPADYKLNRSMMLSTWLHALWRPVTSPACAALADTALLVARDFRTAADYAMRLAQELTKDQASQWVKLSTVAPQLVESILQALYLVHEQRLAVADRLLDSLHLQRTADVRINVDAALQQLGTGMKSDELTIHRACAAALSAAPAHPARLLLWRQFMGLYLQRPPCNLHESTPPVGPLFFSGLIKSRTMSTIKKHLQDTIAYHHNEALSLKSIQDSELKPDSSEEAVTNPRDVAKSTNEFLGVLSITDFTEESSESSDSDGSEEDLTDQVLVADVSRGEDNDAFHMYCYHVAAEKMIREFARWLDEGDRVRALPHHADIARFIPEQALLAAWRRVVAQRRCNVDCELLLPAPEVPPPPHQPTVFEATVKHILQIKDRSTDRKRNIEVESALGETNVSDARVLLSLLDTHLQLVEKYALDWLTEVARITSLDEQLLSLVRTLRVPRDLPPQRVRCAKSCKPRTLVPKAREWCISTGAENGIRENRQAARAAVRRLTKPALSVVRAAVALQALARCVGSAATARRVVERARRSVAACGGCLPAHAALLALVGAVAEKWICHDGALCAELLSRWSAGAANSGNALQQALCGTIVAPRQLPPQDWPKVYTALLSSQLPSHATFSYLSKFEVARWAAMASPESRAGLLHTLSAALTRWGHEPHTQHHVLLELIGVHTSALVTSSELCSYVARCAKESAACRLPPQHWTRVVDSVNVHAPNVPIDELGHLLRELGRVWWEARTSAAAAGCDAHAHYAAHACAVLRALQRPFVTAAVALSYAPERVCVYAWSGARESWSPWLQPAPRPLPRRAADQVLAAFQSMLLETMELCPGIEEHLLGEVWEWATGTYLSLAGSGALRDDEPRDQMWSLLRVLQQLPYQRSWVRARHVHVASQACRAPDVQIRSWLAFTLSGFSTTDALTQDDAHLAPQLAAFLCLFTAPLVPFTDQTLSEACRLPWWRLPEVALDEALERFFIEHYNLTLPYHEAPHFRVIQSACELSPYEDHNGVTMRVQNAAREKRSRGISAWQRAASAPKLVAHAAAHAIAVLRAITQLAPYVEESESEVEELLCRAIVIMCIEPAATAVLPVWQQWVSAAPSRLRAACVSAVSSLTAFEPFAALADAAARALMADPECGGWSSVSTRWSVCPWSDPAPLSARGRPHAAYGVTRAHAAPYSVLRPALLALLAADINFIENEAIISTWICLACRTGRACSIIVESLSADCDAARECEAAAAALLASWAAPPRRTLLRMVAMQQQSDVPTAHHRVLCNLALCILSPDNEAALRGFEAACAGLPPAAVGDAATWGRSPRPPMLPRLAVRFHPTQEIYFKEEMDLVDKL